MEGTVCVISSYPPVQGWLCLIYKDTLKAMSELELHVFVFKNC